MKSCDFPSLYSYNFPSGGSVWYIGDGVAVVVRPGQSREVPRG